MNKSVVSPLANLVDPGMLSSQSPPHADDASLLVRTSASDDAMAEEAAGPSSGAAGERPPTPIIGFTPSRRTVQRMAMVWGVIPRKIRPGRTSHALTLDGDRIMREEGMVKPGEIIVQIAGTVRQAGLANSMSIRTL